MIKKHYKVEDRQFHSSRDTVSFYQDRLPYKPLISRNTMDTLGKILIGLVTLVLGLGLFAAITAAFAWVLEHLWNFVVCEMHHPELQMTFWVAMAVMFIFNLLFGSRARSSSNS